MAQKRKKQNTDIRIQSITHIPKDRCSLSNGDVKIPKRLEEKIQALESKRKRRKLIKNDFNTFIKVVELLTKFFSLSEGISKFTQLFK